MRNIYTLVFASCFAFLILHSPGALAQTPPPESDADLDQIEAELEKTVVKPKPAPERKFEDEKIETFSDLGKLAPFSEVSIIQRRYLPKTGRFQLFGGLNYLTNDPWYWGAGLSLRAGYFFTEAWGIEGTYASFTSSDKDSVKDLSSQHAVATNSLINTKSYTGLDVVWTPVYGKMSLINKRIIPFDMYFALGGGSSSTSDSQSPSTFHAGLGQIFALSKAMGFRWDFSWNRFSAKSQVDQSSGTYDNLLLTFGVSFFFPEAKYR